jgi:PAS domain S-box-containing protein
MKKWIFRGNMKSNEYPSALSLLLTVVLTIFFAEALVMFILPSVEEFVSIPVRALIDASLLVVITLPLFYLILYRPMVLYIEYRQGALEKIRKSEEKYRELVEFTNAVHWEADLKTLEFTYMSPQVEKMLGYPLSAWTDYHFWVDHIHPDDREWAPKYCEEHSFKGEDHELVFRMIASDGSVVWIRDTVTVFFGDRGPEKVRGMMLDVTARKTFEESMRKSEEKYRTLVENANDAIFLADAETGTIIDANKKAEGLVGRELEEIIGMHQSELHPADEAENYRVIFEESVREGKTVFENLFVAHKNGRKIPVEISSSVVEVRGKRINQGIFRDISERRKTEAMLREIAEKVSVKTGDDYFRSLVRYLAIEIEADYVLVGELIQGTNAVNTVAASAHGEIIDNFACDLEGTPCDNIVGKSAHIYHNNIQELFPQDKMLVDMGAESYAGIPLFASDGEPLGMIAALRCTPWKTAESSKLLSLLQIFSSRASSEIERRRSEEALRTSEEQYRMIFENSPLGIQHFSEEGVCIDCNEQLAGIMGAPKDSIVGVDILGLLKDKELKAAIRDSLKGGFGHYEGDYVSVLGDKKTAIKADFGPILSPDGSVRGAIGVFEDISERREAEKEKLVFQQEAVRAAQLASVGELAAGVAHEINNPLNGIINYAQILANRLPEKEEGKIAGLITKEGDRISGIVRSLLSFTRRDGEERSLISLAELLREVFALTEMQMKKEGIHITQKIPADLPKLHVNPQQVEQVFLNVIINARHALNERHPERRKKKTLEITGEAVSRNSSPFVRVTFLDRGTGIPADIMEKVTRPFFTTKKKGTGTGLGLSISRNIIEGYDGTIDIESDEGKYTKVIIELPAAVST